jgi:type I restriction enzyme, S subunit
MIQKAMKIEIKKYPAYKDSGAEWLGDLPINWDSIKMKHLFQDVSIKKKSNEELLSITQDQGVVPRTWVENRMVMPSGALESFKYINKGDFAISLRSFEGGLEYCHHDGIISPAYTVLKAKRNFESKFYKYLFKSFSFISELQTSVVGIRQGKNISFEELSYSYLPIPPLPEQTVIAAFLDRKTALIDQAIDIKRRQIELLKERRQILIHKAVTGQLSMVNGKWLMTPKERMKDSGVEWIGEIPEGWVLTKAKFYSNVFVPERAKPDLNTEKDGLPWVTTEHLRNEELFESDITYYVSELSKRKTGSRIIKANSVVATCVGNFGIASKLNFACIINQQVQGFTNLKINPDYLTNLIGISEDYFKNNSTLTTIMYVSKDTFGSMPIPLPSSKEQDDIVNYIKSGTNKIITAISLKEQEIEKLKEYKAALINSAVTGKIKVV